MQPNTTQAFVRGLAACGCPASIRGELVVFEIVPITGRYAGQTIETGVLANELAAWSSVPPHWVHFPDQIVVEPTNARPSPLTGWKMHSRNVTKWGNAKVPEQAWLAHVRGVLSS